MRKIALATVIIFTLLGSLVIGLQAIKANFIPTSPSYEPPTISILSPLNQTYTNNILLHFNITLRYPRSQDFRGISYSIDNQKPILCKNSSNGNTNYNWSTIYENLAEGAHTLQVFVKIVSSNLPSTSATLQQRTFTSNSDIINFTVNTPPTITIISPQNNTYRSTSIPLNFTVNESTTWIRYSIDNQANITVKENTTLTDVPNGYHTLTFYANDTAGNMAKSDTFFFTITAVATPLPIPTSSPTQLPTLEPIPTVGLTPTCVLYPAPSDLTTIVVIVIGVSIITCVSILVYFKKYG